jgi:hypothetical protein
MWEKLSVKILRDIASKYKALHSLGNISKQKKSVLLETLKKVMEFRGNTLFTKAEHGNKRVAEVEEDDEPKAKKPTPKAKEPTPKAKEPTPKAKEPTPKAKEPTPKAKEPTPKAKKPTPKAKEPTPKVIGLFQNYNYDTWVITNKSQVIRLFEKDKSYVVLKKEKSIKEAFDWLLKHTKKDINYDNYTYNILNAERGGYGNFLKEYNLELTETSTKNKLIFYVDWVDDKTKKDWAEYTKYF